jgi:hypothetical protein
MNSFNEILWHQFGAAIDMLENAMLACSDRLWSDPSGRPEPRSRDVVGFWYVAFHALFWLDFYLSGAQEDFTPPAPFTLAERDPAGRLPERPYTKNELLEYLSHCRSKYRATIESLTTERADRRLHVRWGDITFAELLLYNMRHVQHHAAQLNLLLRQHGERPPDWVTAARSTSGIDDER